MDYDKQITYLQNLAEHAKAAGIPITAQALREAADSIKRLVVERDYLNSRVGDLEWRADYDRDMNNVDTRERLF